MSGIPAKLKALQTQRRKLTDSLGDLEGKQSSLEREWQDARKQLDQLDSELAKLKNKGELLVSEHALLRYLERVRGINLDEVREEILSDEVVELAAKLNFADADIPCNSRGFRVRIKEQTIVTILTRN